MAIFRWLVQVRLVSVRLLMAALAMTTVALGLRVSATVQLAALVLVLIGGNVAERLAARPTRNDAG